MAGHSPPSRCLVLPLIQKNPSTPFPSPSGQPCAAVGTYVDGSSDTQGVLLNDSSGWIAVGAPVPSDDTGTDTTLSGVSCAGSTCEGPPAGIKTHRRDTTGSWNAMQREPGSRRRPPCPR